MYLYDYRATERGIQARSLRAIVEQEEPWPEPASTWAADLANERERRRIATIEERRLAGLHQLRRRGMPEWALAIVKEVADRHVICPSDIASRKRHRPIIEARREAAYLVKARKPKLSSVLMGKWFGKDHTSISHLIACYQEATGLPKLVGYDLDRVRMRNKGRDSDRTRARNKSAALTPKD